MKLVKTTNQFLQCSNKYRHTNTGPEEARCTTRWSSTIQPSTQKKIWLAIITIIALLTPVEEITPSISSKYVESHNSIILAILPYP